jgi:hypothetical protein
MRGISIFAIWYELSKVAMRVRGYSGRRSGRLRVESSLSWRFRPCIVTATTRDALSRDHLHPHPPINVDLSNALPAVTPCAELNFPYKAVSNISVLFM